MVLDVSPKLFSLSKSGQILNNFYNLINIKHMISTCSIKQFEEKWILLVKNKLDLKIYHRHLYNEQVEQLLHKVFMKSFVIIYLHPPPLVLT